MKIHCRDKQAAVYSAINKPHSTHGATILFICNINIIQEYIPPT
jgi:hypothetical protein